MNPNLSKAIRDIEKVDALMYAIEGAYLNIEVLPEDFEKANKGINAFYALWDAISMVSKDLEALEGDEKVVNVIYAVNNVRAKKE